MSVSDAVETGYRIQPTDLRGQETVRLIVNVSYQGIEDMSPVLHLDGTTKRLALDQEQSRQMMILTQSSIPEDWVGARIRLIPKGAASGATVTIAMGDVASRPRRWALMTSVPKWTSRVFHLIVALAALALLVWLAIQIGLTW